MLNVFQQASHGVLPQAAPDEASRQEFVKSLKQYIQGSILPGLGPVYKTRASRKYAREKGHEPADRHEIRRAMVTDTYFQNYAAVNRISQELMWDSVIDSVERDRATIEEKIAHYSAA